MRMAEPEAVEKKAPQVQANPLATQITPLVHRMPAQSVEEEEEKPVALKPLIQRVPMAVREDDEEEQVAPKLEPGAELQEEEYAPESREGRQLLAHELTHVVQQNGSQVQRAQPRATGQAPQVATSVEPDVERIEYRRQTGKGNDNFFVLTRASAPTFFRSAQGAITQPTIQRAAGLPGQAGQWRGDQVPIACGVLAVDTRFDAAKESLSVQDFGIDQDSVPPTMTQSDDWRRMMSMILGDPTTHVAVLGFSDCIGTEQNNQGLRRRRADAVVKAMPAEAQAKVSSIFKGWWGILTYLFPNDTAENRARNRMVLVALMRSGIDSCDGLPKATNIDQFIFLVSCLEKRLGLTKAADAPKTLSVLRQLYFGNASWSTPRNRSRIWDDIITNRPWAPGNDPTPKLGAKLLSALQASKEVKFDSSASSTSIEVSHLLTGLDAMMNPQNPAIQRGRRDLRANQRPQPRPGDLGRRRRLSGYQLHDLCRFPEILGLIRRLFQRPGRRRRSRRRHRRLRRVGRAEFGTQRARSAAIESTGFRSPDAVLPPEKYARRTRAGHALRDFRELLRRKRQRPENAEPARVQAEYLSHRFGNRRLVTCQTNERGTSRQRGQHRHCAGGKPPVQTGQPAPVDLVTLSSRWQRLARK